MGSVPGLAIVIVVGLVVAALTAMSRNVANGRTGNRHLDRAERVGRSRMQDALHEAVVRRLAELPPEPRRRPSIDLTAEIDLTSDDAEVDAEPERSQPERPDVERSEVDIDIADGAEQRAVAPIDPEAD
ncbi:MAG: hypothetical protein AAGF02_06970 [Actinomycetota bacterium]